MKKFLFLVIASIFMNSLTSKDLFQEAFELGKQEVKRFDNDNAVRDQTDKLKEFLQNSQLLKQTTSKSTQKRNGIVNTYIFANLLAIYMIQRSIVLESNADIRNNLAMYNDMITIKKLFKKYGMPDVSINEDSIKALFERIEAGKIGEKVMSEEGSRKDWESLREANKTLHKLGAGSFEETINMLENLLTKYDMKGFGWSLFEALKKENSKNILLPKDNEFYEFIQVINLLLSLKTFLFEGELLKLRHALYRFIQLYSLFLIIDEIKPNATTFDILSEMTQLGNSLQKVFEKEERILQEQLLKSPDSLTESIYKNNIKLLQGFNNLLKVVNAAAFDMGIKLFANDLTILSVLL